MTTDVDESRLDDVAALEAADPQRMLRAVATSGAQVRRSRTAAGDAGLDSLREEGRPRAVVVTGMGGSGIAGDVLSVLAGPSSPVPVAVHRGTRLPGWVGAADLVVAVSCSGRTRETLSAADDAIRRGARVVGVGGPDSPLAERCLQARAPFVPVTAELAPRASLWGLTVPVLSVAARMGLIDLGADDAHLELAAARLDAVAESCRPDREAFVNPAKSLALELIGSVPMVWGAGQTGPAAAYRFACQVAENAKLPVVAGTLPEAHHNQVVTFDGALAAAAGEEDFFRDRVGEHASVRLRLVLLHDDDGMPDTAGAVEASAELAEDRGVAVSSLRSEGSSPIERLASLIGVADFASVYLALVQGIDPTPVKPIDALKARAG